jgi:glycine/serine hydroxymethyltransferase
MISHNPELRKFDPELFNAVEKEETRQEHHIELIAS